MSQRQGRKEKKILNKKNEIKKDSRKSDNTEQSQRKSNIYNGSA